MLHVSHRLTLLTSWILLSLAHSAQGATSIVNRPEAVCTYLARTANNGSLARIALDGHRANDPAFPIPEQLAHPELHWELAFKDLLDINHDGKREYVYVVQYPQGRADPSSGIIIVESMIRGPFGIPQNSRKQQELFVYDQSMQEIGIGGPDEFAKALAEDADRYRFVRYRNSYYVVAQRGEELRYALKFDSSNIAQPICAFEQRATGPRMRTHALTTYEWLKRSLEEVDNPDSVIWEYAFASEDFAVAELLIANGRSVNERMGEDSLLGWAIQEERYDVVDWLLKHGADPNAPGRFGDRPLHVAIGDKATDVALKLMQYGADPAPAILDISDLPQAEHKRSLILAAIEHLDYIPEQFLSDALRDDPGLLEDLVKSGAPVRPYGVSWHAGERMKLPLDVDRYVQQKASDAEKAAIVHLFKRKTIPPEDNFAIASYGSYTQGVQVFRYGGSKLTDEDFLSFATALCYYFMPFDCGAEELVSRARTWVGTLKNECPSDLRPVLDESACRLAAYYGDLGYEVHAFSVTENKKNGTSVEWQEFLNTYRAKHGH